MSIIDFEGHRTTPRTRDMIVEARRITKAPLVITQGGFNAGGVAASAGTHDRDAIDFRAKNLTSAQRAEVVLRLRQVGFAAWIRNPSQANWLWHIHCIPIGGDISAGAARQVTAYKNNRNGLASNGKDDGPRLYIQTWETYLARRGPLPGSTPTGSGGKPSVPPATTEGDLTVAEADRVIQQLNAVSGQLQDNNRQWASNIMAEVDKRSDALEAKLTERVEFLRGQVQAYAAFGAKHTDQIEATTAGDVQAALSGDFQGLAAALSAAVEMQKQQGQLLDSLSEVVKQIAASQVATPPKA